MVVEGAGAVAWAAAVAAVEDWDWDWDAGAAAAGVALSWSEGRSASVGSVMVEGFVAQSSTLVACWRQCAAGGGQSSVGVVGG